MYLYYLDVDFEKFKWNNQTFKTFPLIFQSVGAQKKLYAEWIGENFLYLLQ